MRDNAFGQEVHRSILALLQHQPFRPTELPYELLE